MVQQPSDEFLEHVACDQAVTIFGKAGWMRDRINWAKLRLFSPKTSRTNARIARNGWSAGTSTSTDTYENIMP
jgi:hypothetical protein